MMAAGLHCTGSDPQVIVHQYVVKDVFFAFPMECKLYYSSWRKIELHHALCLAQDVCAAMKLCASQPPMEENLLWRRLTALF